MAFNIDSTIYNYLELVKKIVEKAELTNKDVWYYDISSTETTTEKDSLVIKSDDMKITDSANFASITAKLIDLKNNGLQFDIDDDGIIYLKSIATPVKKFNNIVNLDVRSGDKDSMVIEYSQKYFDYFSRYKILIDYEDNININTNPIFSDIATFNNEDINRFITFITDPTISKSNYTHLIQCLKYYYHMGLLLYNYNYITTINSLLCTHDIFSNVDAKVDAAILEKLIPYAEQDPQESADRNYINQLLKLGIAANTKQLKFKHYSQDALDQYYRDSEYDIISTQSDNLCVAYDEIKNAFLTHTVATNIYINDNIYETIQSAFVASLTTLNTKLNDIVNGLDEITRVSNDDVDNKLHYYRRYIEQLKLYFDLLKTICNTVNASNISDPVRQIKSYNTGTIIGQLDATFDTQDNDYIIGDNIEKISYTELNNITSNKKPVIIDVNVNSELQDSVISNDFSSDPTLNTYNHLQVSFTSSNTDSFGKNPTIDASSDTFSTKIIYIRSGTGVTFNITTNGVVGCEVYLSVVTGTAIITNNINDTADSKTWNTDLLTGTYKFYVTTTANSDPDLALIANYFTIQIVSEAEFCNYYKKQFFTGTDNMNAFNRIFTAINSFAAVQNSNTGAWTLGDIHSFGGRMLLDVASIKQKYEFVADDTNGNRYIRIEYGSSASTLSRENFSKLNTLNKQPPISSDAFTLEVNAPDSDDLLYKLKSGCFTEMVTYFGDDGDFANHIKAITDIKDALDTSVHNASLHQELIQIITYCTQLKDIHDLKNNFKVKIAHIKSKNTEDFASEGNVQSIESNNVSIKASEKKYKENADKYKTKNAELNNIVKSNVYNNIFLYITIVILILICLGIIYINNHKASLKTQYSVMVITFLLLYYIIYTNVTINVTEDFNSQCSADNVVDLSGIPGELVKMHEDILNYLTYNMNNDIYSEIEAGLVKEKNKYDSYAKSSKSKVNNLELVLNDEFINAIKSKELVKFLILFTAICIVCFIVQTNVEDLTTTSIIFIILFIIILSIYFYNINLMTRTKHDNKYWNHRMTMK